MSSARRAHEEYARAKTLRRLAKKTDRKDFISYILPTMISEA